MERTVDAAARGVEFEYEGFEQDDQGSSSGQGPLIAWFRDPAGNVLSIIEQGQAGRRNRPLADADVLRPPAVDRLPPPVAAMLGTYRALRASGPTTGAGVRRVRPRPPVGPLARQPPAGRGVRLAGGRLAGDGAVLPHRPAAGRPGRGHAGRRRGGRAAGRASSLRGRGRGRRGGRPALDSHLGKRPGSRSTAPRCASRPASRAGRPHRDGTEPLPVGAAGAPTSEPAARARLRLRARGPSRWSVVDDRGGAWFPEGRLRRWDFHDRPLFHGHDLELEVPAVPLSVTCAREHGVRRPRGHPHPTCRGHHRGRAGARAAVRDRVPRLVWRRPARPHELLGRPGLRPRRRGLHAARGEACT